MEQKLQLTLLTERGDQMQQQRNMSYTRELDKFPEQRRTEIGGRPAKEQMQSSHSKDYPLGEKMEEQKCLKKRRSEEETNMNKT